MTLIQRIKQRYTDFIHEGAIRRVQDEIAYVERSCACTSDDYLGNALLAKFDAELRNLESKRSPSQLKRMGVDSK